MFGTRSIDLPCLLAVLSLSLILGCGGQPGTKANSNATGTTVFNPPETSYARNLGIPGPVTEDQARQIAEAAAHGTAFSSELEDEDGTQVFGVHVDGANGRKDVKVRVSDGAVTRIDSDEDTETGEGDESED